jgi:TnpA family transposase
MPVELLTLDQETRYGRFTEDPTSEQLAKYFWFDDKDRAIILRHRGAHNRLGFAVQLGTVRFLGTFLPDPTAVPSNVIDYIVEQLGLDPQNFIRYQAGESRWDHTREIRQIYDYYDFTDQPGHWRLVRWLYTRAWLTAERPSVLFDLATARCIEQKILLPGVTVLARLIAQVRDRASVRLWNKLTRLPDKIQCLALEDLLKADPKTHKTGLDRLRQPPTQVTSPGLLKALNRLEEIRSLGGPKWDVSGIPSGRLRTLARYAAGARAQAITRMGIDRRIATLVAIASVFAIQAQDDVLDILDRFLADLFTRTDRRNQKERLRTLRDLDGAARQLREVCAMLLDDTMSDIRNAVFSKVSKEALSAAIQTVDELTRSPDQTAPFEELFRYYSTIRKFLPKLMANVNFEATPAGRPVLAAWEFLRDHNGAPKKRWIDAPIAGMTASWRKVVIDEHDRVNPRAYTFWVLEQMWEAIRRHDIYVVGSERYDDPRSQLLQGSAWETVRPQVLRTLDWSSRAEEALAYLEEELDAAYCRTATRWSDNSAVRLDSFAGRERLILTPLDRLEEPDSLQSLRDRVQGLLPHPDLPELLLEVNRWTDFADAFTHFSEGGSRVKDLAISMCAVLIAQACNIGLDPVVQPGVPALERDRLTWVEQNYFRAETLTQANACLVSFHTRLSLAQTWGGGEVASADGLRFVTPVRTIHAGPNPKYFGSGRGVTYYNFTSDQFTGFNGIVIPGTLRDSLYLLEGILEQQTILQPREVMTDTAGYSDIIFGLFGFLGYQFSPRLADIGEARFWRLDPESDYGVLNGLAKQRIRRDIIIRYWDDMLRVAGSLKLGTVNATRMMQTLQRGGKPTMLGRAISEFGRIYKTRYLLAYLDDAGYRRRILTQLNRGESRHSLARAVFYGKRGEIRQPYREGQEDQLGALGLVVNAIVLWNTRYMGLALDLIRESGQSVNTADVQRLSPLGYEHINIMGRYSFNLPEDIAQGRLRSLLPLDRIVRSKGYGR